jgi:hypothetical protein
MAGKVEYLCLLAQENVAWEAEIVPRKGSCVIKKTREMIHHRLNILLELC